MVPDPELHFLFETMCSVSAAELEQIFRRMSGKYANGELSVEHYELLDAAYRARMAEKTAGGPRSLKAITFRPTTYRSREEPRSPDREKSRQRRRTLGGSSGLPPSIRKDFTEGQRAILFVIGEEVRRKGSCDWPIDRIAAQSGMCRTSVQDLLHKAKRAGLLAVLERPRKGQKNLTNIVKIASREWGTWLNSKSDRQHNIGSNRANFSGTTKNKIKKERVLSEEGISSSSGGGGVSCPQAINPMNPERRRSPASSEQNAVGLAIAPVNRAKLQLSMEKIAAGFMEGTARVPLGGVQMVISAMAAPRLKRRKNENG